MNANAKKLLDFAREMKTQHIKTAKDSNGEVLPFTPLTAEDVSGSLMSTAEFENALYGDGGLVELRLIKIPRWVKDGDNHITEVDPLIDGELGKVFHDEQNHVPQDSLPASPERMKEFLDLQINGLEISVKDFNGNIYTLIAAKRAGNPHATVYFTCLGEDGKLYPDEDRVACYIKYMDDTRHPWQIEDTEKCYLLATDLQAPSKKAKRCHKMMIPKELFQRGLKFSNIAFACVKALIVEINKDKKTEFIKLETAGEFTVANYLGNEFKSPETMIGGKKVFIAKRGGEEKSFIFIDGTPAGKTWWKRTAIASKYQAYVQLKVAGDRAMIEEISRLLKKCSDWHPTIGSEAKVEAENQTFEQAAGAEEAK